jgi:hypothetical protein
MSSPVGVVDQLRVDNPKLVSVKVPSCGSTNQGGCQLWVIIVTWDTHAAWHEDATFVETRKRHRGTHGKPGEQWWHEVILDVQLEARAPQ